MPGCCRGDCTADRGRLICLATFTPIALIFSIITNLSCRFFAINNVDGGSEEGGIFKSFYRYQECVSWSTLGTNLDASSKAAQAFAIIAPVLGGMSAILVWIMMWIKFPRFVWKKVLVGWLMGACMSQALTFLIMKQVNKVCDRSDDGEGTCELGVGSIFSIVAAALYFIIGIVVCCTPRPDSTVFQRCICVTALLKLANRLGFVQKKERKMNGVLGITLLLTLLCLAFSVTAVANCKFIGITYRGNTDYSGLFKYYYPPDGSCRGYEKGDIDGFTNRTEAGRAFGGIACIFGGLLLILLSMIPWENLPNLLLKLLPFWAMLTCLFQGLTFLYLKQTNDDLCSAPAVDCKLGVDGILSAIATAFYFLVGVVICVKGESFANEEEIEYEGAVEESKMGEKEFVDEEERERSEKKLGVSEVGEGGGGSGDGEVPEMPEEDVKKV